MLGIVVDDAIIVGENIYRHQEEHGDGMRGSIEGAYEIAKPVTFAVLTTVAAFSPLLFVPGRRARSSGSYRWSCDRRGPWRRFQSRFADGPEAVRAGRLPAPCSRRRSAGGT